MFDPSPIHLLILGVIVLLVLGPKRLPEMARSLGRGIREFKGSIGGDDAPAASATATAATAELLDARQATPAPTPEIAEAELVATANGHAR